MLKRLTAGQLRAMLEELPEDVIICCQSDEEGNRTMTCYDASVQEVGKEYQAEYRGEKYTWVGCEDIAGIDLEKDKGKKCLIIHPMF